MNNQFFKMTVGLVFTFVTAVGISPVAYSFTECTVEIEKIGSEDEGYIILYFENGGIAYLGPTDSDTQNSLLLATSALLENKSIIVKYEADNVECTAQARFDVMGIYLVK